MLKAYMPVISDDGPTVRKIRSWLGKGGTVRLRFELDGKPHAPKGVRAGLGAARAAFSDERMTFEGVKPGKHALLVDRVEGFKRIAERAVEVGSGETVEVVIALERES